MGDYVSYVAGIIDKNRRRTANQLEPGMTLKMVRDPRNPADKNAVELRLQTGSMVGYVPAKHSSWVAERMDKDREVRVVVEKVKRQGWFWNKRVFVDIRIQTGANAI